MNNLFGHILVRELWDSSSACWRYWCDNGGSQNVVVDLYAYYITTVTVSSSKLTVRVKPDVSFAYNGYPITVSKSDLIVTVDVYGNIYTLKEGEYDFTDNQISLTDNTITVKYGGITKDASLNVLGPSTVSFYNGSQLVDSKSVYYGHTVQMPEPPVKNGYTFIGWVTTYNGNTAFDFNQGITSEKNAYASWRINRYTISFESNGGSAVGAITKDYNATVSAPNEPTRAGYIFVGWYTDGELKNKYAFTTMPAEDITLFAKWDINSYTITFEPNGGSAVGDITKDYKSAVTAPSEPTRTGYTFVGWYADSVLTNKYAFSTMPAEDITLFAKWDINSYTITFDSNGGSAVEAITKDYKSAVTAPSEPTRTGYTFVGWYADGELKNKYTFTTMPAEDIMLFAKWDINSYTMTFEPNGRSAVGAITRDYMSAVTAPSEPTRTGYTFVGWYADSELKNKYTFTTMPAEDIMLFAKWDINSYTITFEPNGGSAVGAITKDYMSAVTAPTDPTRTGYTFVGWYTDSELTNKYAFTTMPAEDITLFAKWDINSYTITFDSNGGSAVGAITRDYMSAVTAPRAPTRTGYTFVGWHADGELKNKYAFTTIPAEDIMLFAKWDINSYTITFEPNGGSTVEAVTEDYITTVTAPTDPIKTGYTFVGWYTDSKFTKKFSFTTMSAENITLFAKWDINSYTIRFDSNGGSTVGVIKKDYNNTVTAPSDPTRTGYTFVGWYTDSELTNKYAFTTMPAEDINLYAGWNANQYTVSFNNGGATGGAMTSVTFVYDKEYTVSCGYIRQHTVHLHYQNTLQTDDFVVVSCQFAGWSYNGQVFSANEALKNLVTDNGAEIILTAVWTPAIYSLPVAEKVSHTFLGWFDDGDGTALIGSTGESITVTQDTDLWCRWKKDEFLESFGEEEFKEIVDTVKESETGKYSVDSKFNDGNEFDTLEEAIQYAGECYKKEQADEAIGNFEEKLSAVGGSIDSFEERRQEILSSVAGNEQTGYTISGSEETYATIEEAIHAATVIVQTEILTEKEEVLKNEIGGYLHECDGETIVTAVQISSGNIDDIGLDEVDDLSDTYDSALAAVRLAKKRQTVINKITEEINVYYAAKIYTDESLNSLFDIYNEITVCVGVSGSLNEIDSIYTEWTQKTADTLRVIALNRQSSDDSGKILGSVTSPDGLRSDAVLVLERKNPQAENVAVIESDLKGMRVLTVYDISVSVQDGDGTYIVTLMLPDGCELIRKYSVVYLGSDGTVETFDVVPDENGYITFTTTHFSEYYIVGKPPVSILWMIIPAGIALFAAIGIAFIKRKEDIGQ